jgi:glycosyltransferase involved in cell wall biosynthesis
MEKAKKIKRRSRLAGKALAVPEKAARKLLRNSDKPAEAGQAFNPMEGDTLFILADWHGSDPDFVDYVVSLKNSGITLVQVAYDLLPIVTPQYSGHATESLTRYTKAIYPLCDLILAISQHTEKDITEWLTQNKLRVPSIKVIRLGDDFEIAKPAKPVDEYFTGAAKDFLLCVGTIEARKNHALLYYTYKLAAQKGINLPDLVIVGRRGWKSDDIYEMMTNDPQTKHAFIILEKASDEELSWLYQNCSFSIYPSFYEGWGLPIAESIAHNTPCICSNTSSMPEIAGDLIPYFSPYSADECLYAIQNMLKAGAIHAAKRKIGAYKAVSWNETFGVVKKLIKESHAKN